MYTRTSMDKVLLIYMRSMRMVICKLSVLLFKLSCSSWVRCSKGNGYIEMEPLVYTGTCQVSNMVQTHAHIIRSRVSRIQIQSRFGSILCFKRDRQHFSQISSSSSSSYVRVELSLLNKCVCICSHVVAVRYIKLSNFAHSKYLPPILSSSLHACITKGKKGKLSNYYTSNVFRSEFVCTAQPAPKIAAGIWSELA